MWTKLDLLIRIVFLKSRHFVGPLTVGRSVTCGGGCGWMGWDLS